MIVKTNEKAHLRSLESAVKSLSRKSNEWRSPDGETPQQTIHFLPAQVSQ